MLSRTSLAQSSSNVKLFEHMHLPGRVHFICPTPQEGLLLTRQLAVFMLGIVLSFYRTVARYEEGGVAT